jgi:hypothetical protein
MYDSGAKLANVGLGTNLPMAPAVLGEWGQRATATEDKVYDYIGGPPITTPGQEVTRAAASGAGGMMFPGMGPSGLLKFATVGAGLGAGQTAALQAIEPTPPDIAMPGPAQITPEQRAVSPMAPGTEPAYSEVGGSGRELGEAGIVFGFGLLGLAGGRAAANRGTKISQAARMARAADPEFLKQANDYNNSLARRAGDQIGDVDAPQPPIPNANLVNAWLVKAKEWGLDASEGAQSFVRLTAENPGASERLAKQVAAAFDEQLWETKNRQFLMTGHDRPSGVSIPSPLSWVHDAERLGKDGYQLFNHTLAARDEINNRTELAKQRAARGEPPNPIEDRHNFYRQDLAQLNAIIARGMADPRIGELVQRHDAIHTGLMDVALKRGFVTTADHARIKAVHPNYLPEGDVDGRIRHSFGPRQVAPRGGIEQMNTKATSLMAQHMERLMREIDMNDMRRAMKEHIVKWQNDVPNAPQLLYKAVAPNPLVAHQAAYPTLGIEAKSPREKIIPIRTGSGVEHWRTDNNFLYDMLTGQNATRARIHFDSAGKWRQMLQWGTTGTASLSTGRIVPVRNLVYSALQAPINATGGVYGGPVSALTRGKLPKTLTAPLDAPLNVVGALGQYGINWVSRNVLYRGAEVFRPENPNTLTQIIRSIVGDGPLRLLSETLMHRYRSSVFYEGQSYGLGGQSLQQRMRMPVVGREKGSNDKIRLQMAQLEPRVLINIDGGPTARPFVINLQKAVTDAFTHASESTHDFLYSLNRNNPVFKGDKNQAVQAVRGIVGDPSVSGIGAVPQALRTHLPYANVAVQGTRAIGKAFAQNPIDTMGAMITSYGSLIALGMLTAFQSQNNLIHMTSEVSSADKATYLSIYNGPNAEDSLIRIPFPSEARWLTGLLHDVMYTLLNVSGAAHDELVKGDVLGILKELWHHEIDQSTAEATKHGINDAFNFVDFPPYIKLGLALGGGTGRVDFARIYNDLSTGNFGFNSVVNTPHERSVPTGLGVNDTSAHGYDGKRWVEMLSSVFGLTAVIGTYAMDLQRYMEQGESFYDALGAATDNWMQGSKDFNPQGNTLLWENSVALSRNPPIVEQTRRAYNTMLKTSGSTADEMNIGLTSPRGLDIPMYGNEQGKIPDDPLMAQLFKVTATYVSHVERTIMPEIRDLEKQLKEVNASNRTPQQRREFAIERQRDLADKWRYVAQTVDETNAMLSDIAGVPIDLHKGIDWYGTPDQFRK